MGKAVVATHILKQWYKQRQAAQPRRTWRAAEGTTAARRATPRIKAAMFD